MARDLLVVDGVTAGTKEKLKALAQKTLGSPNVSALVRHLVDRALTTTPPRKEHGNLVSGDTVRIELRLPAEVVAALDELADRRLSPTRNFYIASVLYEHLGSPVLQADEIGELRNSNYQMAAIGNNLNQLARAFNTVMIERNGKMPELGKKIAALNSEVKSHTSKVLKVLRSQPALKADRSRKKPA